VHADSTVSPSAVLSARMARWSWVSSRRIVGNAQRGMLWCWQSDYSRQQTAEVLVQTPEECPPVDQQLATDVDPFWRTASGLWGMSGAKRVAFLSHWTLDCRRSRRIEWSTVSNAADRSRPINVVTCLSSAAVNTLSRICRSAVSVEWPFL